VRKAYAFAFTQALADLGWTDGRNVRIGIHWGGDTIDRMRAFAQALVGLQPDIIVTSSTPTTLAAQRETRTIPTIFVGVADPVAQHIVARLDRPSGNITGFAGFEASLGGKWLELLSEIVPGLKRAALMFNSDTSPTAYTSPLETAAQSLKVVPIITPVRRRNRNCRRRPGARASRRPCRHAGGIYGFASRADYIGGSPKQRTGGLFASFLCQRRRFALLRGRRGRLLSSRRNLCRGAAVDPPARR
jgi:hypothetical protein